MQKSYDIVIIGGGPAGSSAGLALRKRHPDLSIVLIEASHYEKWRVGETLSPEAGRAFRALGIWESFSALNQSPAYGTSAAWESALIHENEFIFHPEGKGWHLDRVKFDAWMANEAKKMGVDLMLDTHYLGHEKAEEGIFRLRFKCNGASFQIKASFVIDATGRSSGFMKKEGGKRTRVDRLSGAVGIFKSRATKTDSQKAYTLVEATENGWWYSSRLPDDKLVVAFMTDADILKRKHLHQETNFNQTLHQSSYTKARITKGSELEELNILSAASLIYENVCGKNWIAVGDSVSTFDPLSSQGVYKAIRSGLFAGYAISDYRNGNTASFKKYERFIREEYEEYLGTRCDFYSSVKRWPKSPFWTRRGSKLNVAV